MSPGGPAFQRERLQLRPFHFFIFKQQSGPFLKDGSPAFENLQCPAIFPGDDCAYFLVDGLCRGVAVIAVSCIPRSRNCWRFSREKYTWPNLSLIPYSLIMLFAISVALARSLWAPVDMSEKTISSAALPPRRQAISLRSQVRMSWNSAANWATDEGRSLTSEASALLKNASQLAGAS